jgi:hypothetical protein
MTIQTTLIEGRGPHFATFQSHSEKVAQHKHGIL